MADNSFTFWANMKESIDVYEGNPVYQYKLYDALTEYALYGIWPEDDGTMETKNIIMFVQSMVPSIEKSSNFSKKCAESGSVGGRKEKVTDEQIFEAVKRAAAKNGKIPKREDVIEIVKEMYDITINVKTVSRRCPDNLKKEIAEEFLRQNRDIINVPGTQGQNEDKINVPETLGQNGDKINNVPGTLGHNIDPNDVWGFNF